jgi:hypothetical protein
MESARLFLQDLVKAAHAWGTAPALPIVSILVMLPIDTEPLVTKSLKSWNPEVQWSFWVLVLLLPVDLFGLGWLGTQRIWYQRVFQGASLAAGEAWQLSWRFVGRFFVLGLLVVSPPTILIGAVALWQVRTGTAAPHLVLPVWVLIVYVAYWFVMDVLLTFVTPALAYTTRRVREAWAIGQRMLRSTWPHCAVYALLPPLTLLSLGTVNPAGLAPEVAVTISIASTLIGLLTKGAIASFYIKNVAAEVAAASIP